MNPINNVKVTIYQCIFVLIVSALCFASLEMSNQNAKLLEGVFLYLNIGTVFFSILFCGTLLKSIWLSAMIHTVVLHIWAIGNYYVILYRGIPLAVNDVFNIGTAANVISGYQLSLSSEIYEIIMCFLITIIIALILREYKKNTSLYENREMRICKGLVLIFLISIFTYTGYVSENSLKPHTTLTWSWRESYHQYGYLASTLELFVQSLNPVDKPEQYDEKKINSLSEVAGKTNVGQNPDIILILNETYYDLERIISFTADKGYMEYYNSLDNAVRGYAVVPIAGGGTNNSEYELLTSNSLQLAPNITPFNTLNFNHAK